MNNNGIKIRSADEDDRQGILNLLNSVFSENQRSTMNRGEEYWKWKFTSNVFGDSIITIAEDGEQVIGIDHLWPWELQCRGVNIKACQPCDSAVLSTYRGKGIFQKMRIRGIEEAQKSDRQLLFNFPNNNSLTANIRIGAHYLGRLLWWVKILKPIEMIEGYFSNDLASIAKMDKKFSLDICKLDEIANEYIVFDKYLDIHRKEGFHEWRYFNKPNREYGFFSLENGHKKIGSVFTLNQKGVVREMVLVDIVGDPGLFKQLIKEMVEIAKFLGATFLALMNNERFATDQLWKNGFFRKQMKNMVVLPINLAIENKIMNLDNWSLVTGLHDSI